MIDKQRIIDVCEALISSKLARSYVTIARKCGKSSQFFTDIKSGKSRIGLEFLDLLKKNYPINIDYILSGKGSPLDYNEISMMQIAMQESESAMAVAANIAPFQGGGYYYSDTPVSAGQYDIVSTTDIPSGYISLPNVNAKWFFPVIGCSMEPDINAGDTIGVNPTEGTIYDPDKIYMIITPHERMIKRLRRDSNNDEIVWAISTNHKEIKLLSNEIKAVYHVVYVMKGKLL